MAWVEWALELGQSYVAWVAVDDQRVGLEVDRARRLIFVAMLGEKVDLALQFAELVYHEDLAKMVKQSVKLLARAIF